jgi:hypothetical protein
VAGDGFLMDVLRLQGAGWTPAWRRIDPRGNVDLGPVNFADRDPHRLLRTGTCTLLREGRVFEGDGVEADHAFRPQKARRQVFAPPYPGGGHAAGLDPVDGPEGGPALGLTGLEPVEIDDPATNITGDVSFDLRFRPDAATGTWQSLVYSGGGSVAGRQYTLWLSAEGYLHFTSSDVSGQIDANSAASSVNFGDWNHVVGVVDQTGQALRPYLDRVLAGCDRAGPCAARGGVCRDRARGRADADRQCHTRGMAASRGFRQHLFARLSQGFRRRRHLCDVRGACRVAWRRPGGPSARRRELDNRADGGRAGPARRLDA